MATMTKSAETGNQVVGKVFILYGTVKAVSPDGTVRLLAPNSPVYADDRIITESDGSVSIQFDGPHVTQLDLGRMTQIIIDQDVYAGVAPDAVSDAAAEAEQVRQSLLQGDQPLDLEATAAGEPTSGASNTTVTVIPTGTEVTPVSGAPTTTAPEAPAGTAPAGTTTLTAAPDFASVKEDAGTTAQGNVLTNDPSGIGTTVTWGGTEADNSAIAGLAKYGTLTLNADGSYTFELNNSSAAVQGLTSADTITKSINYTVTDAVGAHSSAQLTITITGADDAAQVTIAPAGHVVYEHALTSGYDTSIDGSLTVSATDGIAKITVEGKEFTLAQLQALSTGSPSAGIPTGEGTLVLTAYSGDSFGGTVGYTYTLNKAQNHTRPDHDTNLTDSVVFNVEGVGGTTGAQTLAVTIIDDVPTIPAGPYYVTAYDGSAININTPLNVIAGDKITFSYSFDAHDAKPYNDFGFVVINGQATKLADVGQVGSNSTTGWETFTYVAPATGPLQIGFGVMNTGDDMNSSHLLIDKLAKNGSVVQSFETGNLTGWNSAGAAGSVTVVTTHDVGVKTPIDGIYMAELISTGADKVALESFFHLPQGHLDTVSETAGDLVTPTYAMTLDAAGLGPDGAGLVTCGTLAHSYGADDHPDNHGTVLLTGVTLPPPDLGFTHTLSADGLTLTISEAQGGLPVPVLEIKLEDNTSGNYLVSQLHAIEHPAGTNVAFTLQYRVTDSDGDYADGHAGSDIIYAGPGGENLVGVLGNNHLVGGDGADILHGGPGTDILTGGKGADFLTGGKGADIFKVGEGHDHITDYSKAEGDKVDISKVLNTPDPDHTRLGVINDAGNAELVIYDNAAHSQAIGGVTFDNIAFNSSLTPDLQLTSLLDQVDLDHTV